MGTGAESVGAWTATTVRSDDLAREADPQPSRGLARATPFGDLGGSSNHYTALSRPMSLDSRRPHSRDGGARSHRVTGGRETTQSSPRRRMSQPGPAAAEDVAYLSGTTGAFGATGIPRSVSYLMAIGLIILRCCLMFGSALAANAFVSASRPLCASDS